MDEPLIATLVSQFYARVRRDPDLGPVFNQAIRDWDHHLETLTAFWSALLLPPERHTAARYKGNPMAAHLKHLERLTPALFDRWLALWSEATADVLPPDAATDALAKAARIATSLQLGLFYRPAA
ncbi:group III truncated hemoglobin [Nitrospirillum sp. BR 11164]|uniref:group III truncated hemoglobin n=1 Tax=Nitrospirillum sp. BR 11164 TaxID=3104324 RepID=UPI002AFE7308|nr:group III truncated hemoglobin [Nitrospirillum sp. BR 11164]MEA1648931.1 group III truncated hemoglobin [Nitrospirillum sp. BR 11164]